MEVSTAQLEALLQHFPCYGLLKGSRNRKKGKGTQQGTLKAMGKARVTPNAAREVRDEKGKARGLSSAAAEMLAGRWENKGILTAAQVCIEELSTQGCSCDAAVPG